MRRDAPGLRPAGGGGENRTRVQSSVPQDIYERTPGFAISPARLPWERIRTSQSRYGVPPTAATPAGSESAEFTPDSAPADRERAGAGDKSPGDFATYAELDS